MKKSSFLLGGALLLVSLFTTSCKEVLGSLDNPVSSYLTVSSTSVKLEPGKTVRIDGSTISTNPITWESANPEVATVQGYVEGNKQYAIVTAIADGETTITAKTAANENYLAGVAEVKVWTCDPDMYEPLTLIAKDNGGIYINFVNYNTAANTLAEPINYTINNGDVQSVSPTISTNTSEWVFINVNANDTIRFTSKNEKLAGRGYNAEYDYYFDQYVRINPYVECAAYGNVMSLITPDGNFYKNRSIKKSNALAYLFNTWSYNLVNHETRSITLPATEVADSCYLNMFSGCYGLKSAPVLPAKEVGVSSYQWMFNNCTSLEAAPELPATTLGDYCYYAMFYNCDALTEAPVLPATEMKDYCYAWMFEDCDGLKNAPVLPSTTLANRCYNGMFARCHSLESAPALPATKLADGCYYSMFNNCTSLKAAPALPATELASSCYRNMFYSCSSIKTAPELPATEIPEQAYGWMLSYTGITEAPELPATKLSYNCYAAMFEGTPIAKAPKLPATTLASSCYYAMFWNCNELTEAPALPATTLAPWCYESMFNWCTNLKKAPDLNAAELPSGCYYQMFNNCSKLSSVKCLATEMTAYNAISGMLNNAGTDESVTKRTFTRSTDNNNWVNNDDWAWDLNQWYVPTSWTIDPAITAASAPARRAAAVKGTPIKTPTFGTKSEMRGGEDTGGVKAPAKTNI